MLTERGLEPALAGLAARAPVPVTVTTELDQRLDPALESAAYFLVSEALTNVAKYAHATFGGGSIAQIDGHVLIGVRDDGIGGADPAAAPACAGSPTASRRSTDCSRSRARRAAAPSYARSSLRRVGHPTPAR